MLKSIIPWRFFSHLAALTENLPLYAVYNAFREGSCSSSC